MTNKKLYLLTLLAFTYQVEAQDLASIGGEDPLKISGGVALNQVFYQSGAAGSRRDPFTYVASGNINFSLYGWSVPLSFTMSNQNSSFQQPFNQYSMSPTYKWIQAHIGYVSMNFSPYTLSGHIFSGAGVDLEPQGKFKISAMYGRLLKAVEPDSSIQNSEMPAFKRMGYGAKVTYDLGGDLIEVIMFKSQDEITSIGYVPEELEIFPEENLVLSVKGEKALFGKFKLIAEYASSALTRDTRIEKKDGPNNIYGHIGGLFTQRESTAYYHAFKSSIQYTAENYGAGINYERIDPGYKTHGAYFFNNDLENVTVNFNTRLLQNKANIATNVGLQRNNLNNDKLSAMKRFVGSVNLGVVPTERINVNLSYSSFQSYTNIRSQFDFINQSTPYDNIDTLNYQQVNHSINGNVSYFLSAPSAENKSMLTASLSYNRTNDEQGSTKNITSFYNANCAYNVNFKQSGMGLTVSINATKSTLVMSKSFTFGPNVGINKTFLDKKLQTGFSVSYNSSHVDEIKTGEVINFRLNGGFKPGKKHNLNASLFLLFNNTQTANTSAYKEFTANLGYAYSF